MKNVLRYVRCAIRHGISAVWRRFRRKGTFVHTAKIDGKAWDMAVVKSWGEELRTSTQKNDEIIFWR